MVRDGTESKALRDGLYRLCVRYKEYHQAFHSYNSGSMDRNDLNDAVDVTGTHVQSVINGLMDHEWAGM